MKLQFIAAKKEIKNTFLQFIFSKCTPCKLIINSETSSILNIYQICIYKAWGYMLSNSHPLFNGTYQKFAIEKYINANNNYITATGYQHLYVQRMCRHYFVHASVWYNMRILYGICKYPCAAGQKFSPGPGEYFQKILRRLKTDNRRNSRLASAEVQIFFVEGQEQKHYENFYFRRLLCVTAQYSIKFSAHGYKTYMYRVTYIVSMKTL